MTLLSLCLEILALFFIALGVGSFVAVLKGCLVLRRLERARSGFDRQLLLRSPLVPGISILAAPPDISEESRAFVRRLLDVEYGDYELVLVLSGPSEAEFAAWAREFRLNLVVRGAPEDLPTTGIRGVYESVGALRLVVVDKQPGSYADALNAGVNVASFPVVAVVDPDCEFGQTLMSRLIVPMLEDPERTVAVCGAGPAAPSGTLASRIGALESLRAWLVRCAAFSAWDLTMPLPGAAVLLRRQTVLDCGGFRSDATELLLRVRSLVKTDQKPWRIACVPEKVNRAIAPASTAELRQRTGRDQAALVRLKRQSQALPTGLSTLQWTIPAMLCYRLVRPILETAAYVLAIVGLAFGWVTPSLAGLVLLTTAGMGLVVSMAAVALSELAHLRGSDPGPLARLFVSAIPENFGYRQLRNLWLIQSFFSSQSPKKQNRESAIQNHRSAASTPAVYE